MSNAIWVALGLVLILEGVGPFVVPDRWRTMVLEMAKQSDNQLRRIGGCLVVAGAVIVYMVW